MDKIADYRAKWADAIQKKDYQWIYAQLSNFLKKTLPKLYFIATNNPEFEFLEFYCKIITEVIIPNFEKNQKINEILDNFYNKTSLSSLSKLSYPEQNVSSQSELDPDFQANEKDIRDLVENNISSIFNLFRKKDLPFRSELRKLILYLLEVFPDASEELIPKLYNFYTKNLFNDSEFVEIMEKGLDKTPSPIIFYVITQIQESMMNQESSSELIHKFEVVLNIFRKYVQYYPEYFITHINLYFGLIGQYSEELSNIAVNLLNYYARQGNETLEELFFDLYQKASVSVSSIQNALIELLKEVLSNGSVFIFEKKFSTTNGFDSKLSQILDSNFNHPNIALRELTIEISIQKWKFEFQIEFSHTSPHNFPSLDPLIKILNRITELHVFSPYLLLEAVSDIDQMLSQRDEKHSNHQLEEELLQRFNIEEDTEYFSMVKSLVSYLQEIQNQ